MADNVMRDGGDIVQLMLPTEIEKILECPVCKESAVPPIFTCLMGHIICTFCRPNVQYCAVCRQQYTETRNLPLEEIFNGTTFVCKFKRNGCGEIIFGEKYKLHLRNCKFRSIICGYCSEDVSPIDNYIKHLKKRHDYVRTHNYGYDTEEKEFEFKNWTGPYDIYNDNEYGDGYAFYDGKYFISSKNVKNHVLFHWISVIGDDEDAKKYKAKITFFKMSNDIPHIQWTIPVVSLQSGEPDYSKCTAIPVKPTLEPFLEKNVDLGNGEFSRFVWRHKFTIQKI